MSAAELAFLAAGLVLGAAVGAAAGLLVRRAGGQAASPAVRITITPDAVPRRRAATLAGDPFATRSLMPARGGPGDAEPASPSEVAIAATGATAADAADPGSDRTGVPKGLPGRIAVPIVSEADPLLAALRARPPSLTPVAVASPPLAHAAGATGPAWEDPIDLEVPVLVAVGAARAHGAMGAGTHEGAAAHEPSQASARTVAGSTARTAAELGRGLARIVQGPAGPETLGANQTATGGEREVGAPASTSGPGGEDGDCRDLELEAHEQCRLADAAEERVERLTAQLGSAATQRDRQAEALRAAEVGGDGRSFADVRAAAQAGFQAARVRAMTADDLADAATAWLAEVDRINADAAAAAGQLERARASLEIAVATAEHLAAEVEAARSAAEAGAVACVYARRRAAECAEAAAGVVVGATSPEPGVAEAVDVDAEPVGVAAADTVDARTPPVPDKGSRPVVLAIRPARDASPRPPIERVLGGEHTVLDDIVAQLADDADGRRQWAERLTALLEAILIRAVDSAAVDVPAEHPFWGAFTAEQSRDILAALASLGHHFDGLGGWLDDRAPDQRDLSLAVAHAGLDPMRIRRYPTTAESAELLRDAVILGADYLAAVAPALSVEELVAVLGREGQAFGDLWAAWDRIRPALAGDAGGSDGA